MIYEPIGAYSKNIYVIQELSVGVRSFEELCFVVTERIYDLGDFLMKEDLILFVRDEFALKDLASDLEGAKGDLGAFIKVLLSFRHFMSEDSIDEICKGLLDGGDSREYVRLISRGDFFTENKKYRPAILLYEHSRELMEEESETEDPLYNELLIKLGKLYSLYFLFEKAAECFSLAGDEKRTFFCRKLAMSRVDYVEMMLKEQPDETLAAEVEEMTKEPLEIAELKQKIKNDKSYGGKLATERLGNSLRAAYRRIM